MFAHHRKRVRALFASADALLTLLTFEMAYWMRVHLPFGKLFFLRVEIHIELALFCAAAWVFLGSQRRVYERLATPGGGGRIVETVRQVFFGTLLLVLLQYLLHMGHELSRSFLALFSSLNALALLLFRFFAPAVLGALHREFAQPYHVVLVGRPDRTEWLNREVCQGSPFRILVSASLLPEEANATIPLLLRKQVVDEVIFDVDSGMLPELESVFLHCDEEGVRTRVAVNFFPHVNSEITLDRVGTAPLLTFSAAPLEEVGLMAKRAIDLCGSAAAMVLLSPVFLVVAVLIRLTSEGPVIYRQTRCGLNGRQFTLYKFRSMVRNADELKADLEHLNERSVVFKLAHDPRVTKIGRVLRKYSLDELPQLYNVVRGDMSLVGPRPPLPEEVARYERWQKRRLRMRPGLTCLWAIMGRDRLDFNSWMRTDLSYIDNWSLGLDWAILLRTIPYVLAGRGAH